MSNTDSLGLFDLRLILPLFSFFLSSLLFNSAGQLGAGLAGAGSLLGLGNGSVSIIVCRHLFSLQFADHFYALFLSIYQANSGNLKRNGGSASTNGGGAALGGGAGAGEFLVCFEERRSRGGDANLGNVPAHSLSPSLLRFFRSKR